MHKQPQWKSLGAPAPHIAEREAAAADEFFRRREALRLVVQEPESAQAVQEALEVEDELESLRREAREAEDRATEAEERVLALEKAIHKALPMLGKELVDRCRAVHMLRKALDGEQDE